MGYRLEILSESYCHAMIQGILWIIVKDLAVLIVSIEVGKAGRKTVEAGQQHLLAYRHSQHYYQVATRCAGVMVAIHWWRWENRCLTVMELTSHQLRRPDCERPAFYPKGSFDLTCRERTRISSLEYRLCDLVIEVWRWERLRKAPADLAPLATKLHQCQSHQFL